MKGVIIKECSYKDCDLEVFKQENKCIFHCEKTLENGWIIDPLKNGLTGDPHDKYAKYTQQVELFWKEFVGQVSKKNVDTRGFILPYYNTRMVDFEDDIRNLDEIKFRNCVFVDQFIFESENFENPVISFVESSFYGELRLSLSKVKYLGLRNLKFNAPFAISTEEDVKHIEIMAIETMHEEPLIHKVVYCSVDKLEVWHILDSNSSIRISNCKIGELKLSDLNISQIMLVENIIYKIIEIVDILIFGLSLEKNTYATDTNIIFKNIHTDHLMLEENFSNTKKTRFYDIKVLQAFTCEDCDFKNVYFNDVNIELANKRIVRTTFIDAHLNSIEWGEY